MHSQTISLTIAWVRDLPRLAVSTQVKAARDHGIAEADIITEGDKLASGRRADWPWLMRKLRRGDTLAVYKLRAIYEPMPKRTPRQALYRRLHQIEDAGVDIVELATGLHSANARSRDTMIMTCLDDLARAAQGRDGGRPPLQLSAAEIAIVDRHWRSLRHATNQAAVDAIRAEAQAGGHRELLRLRIVQQYINRFGASGRGARRKG